MTDHLVSPHGGHLVDLTVDETTAAELKTASKDFASWDLTPRQMCDLELLLVGGFSPLTGFMNRADYDSVCSDMRLADGTLWPMPITLNVSSELSESLSEGSRLALRDPEGVMLAVLTVGDVWEIDRDAEAEQVYGTLDRTHPGVAHLMDRSTAFAVGGTLQGVQLPEHYDYRLLRQTPAEVRQDFQARGWQRVVAFQTRNPMHRAHYEMTLRASRDSDATVLIHPVVGLTKPGDLRELLARLRAVLRRTKKHYLAQSEHQPRVKIGTAVLDLDAHKMYDSDGKEVKITSMEFDLLKAFIEHPNQVLNRDQLLEFAHNREWEPFDRSVDIRIARLRRKVEPEAQKPQFIKTVRGAGYIFVPS